MHANNDYCVCGHPRLGQKKAIGHFGINGTGPCKNPVCRCGKYRHDVREQDAAPITTATGDTLSGEPYRVEYPNGFGSTMGVSERWS